MKKVFTLIILFLIITFNNKAFAYDYTIEKYDVDIVVSEDNKLNITEKIDANFNVDKHGIFRNIPCVNNIKKDKYEYVTQIAKIKNISVNETYKTSFDGTDVTIKIGSPYETFQGLKSYEIKYVYDLGKDNFKDSDEFYFNIIGTGWDTYINNITFSVHMPKEFEKENIKFFTGNYKSEEATNLEYEVGGEEITGRYTERLNPGQAVTIRIPLEEGYFKESDMIEIISALIIIVISAVSAIICFYKWLKRGKDDVVIDVVEFYPPNNLNSLEIGQIYEGNANKKHVLSLLIYLANKGYIKIEDVKRKSGIIKVNDVKITKIKEYDERHKEEKLFLTGLFKNASDKKNKKYIVNNEELELASNEILISDLSCSFYETIDSILSSINGTDKIDKIFKSGSWNDYMSMLGLILLSATTLLSATLFKYYQIVTIFQVMVAVIVSVPISFVIHCVCTKLIPKIIANISITAIAIFFYMCLPFAMEILEEPMYKNTAIFSFICLFGMLMFISLMSKRTKYGTEMLGRINGFKRFLETAEKEKLEELVNENPEYFYNILPYTYALGISNKWIKKFETIGIENPSWYTGTDEFNMHTFCSSLNRTMDTANSAMTSMPTSSGGNCGGGGGFSGGGCGGGGGGSW